MTYTVYIQAYNNFPIADWAVSAYLGFRSKQANIKFFEDIDQVPRSKNVILVAFIEDTQKYLSSIGVPPKLALNIPEELNMFTDREIRYMTLDEFFKDQEMPIFVKPAMYAKEFAAGVISKPENKELFFVDHDPATNVLVSSVVDFVSEYRGYVINGKLVGIKHYQGDFRVFPDIDIVDCAVTAYTSAPAGYSIDFGVTSDGRTLLIECNDGWSLGNYGLDDSTYSTLLATRWLELLKESTL
jgi:hypothetical protein